MDSKNETVAESSEPAPTQLLAVALKQLKAEGGLVWWDELCEQIYPDLDPGGRIRQFAEHHERWHMPLDVLIPTLQVLIRLANEFHSVKRTHEFLVAFHEAKTQEGWTEHPTEPSHAEYQALERLGNRAANARRTTDSFPAMALWAFNKKGPLNWQQVATATGFTHAHTRDYGRYLARAGFVEKCPAARQKHQITDRGREQLEWLNNLEV